MPTSLPPDSVVIEAPLDQERLHAASVEACSGALGDELCRSSTDRDATAAWFATVVWLDAGKLHARIELRRRTPDGPVASIRHVDFSEDDSIEQRYRALGLVVASHVLAMKKRASAPSPPAVVPPPAPLPRPPAPEDPRATLGLDAGAYIGPGLSAGPPRLGALARIWATPLDVPLHGSLGARWATASDDATVTWTEVSFGVAARIERRAFPLSFEIRNEAVLQWVQAVAENDATGESDTGRVQRFGARLGLDLILRLAPHVSAFAGIEGTTLRPEFSLEVRGRDAGSEAAARWAAVGGIRLSP